MSNRVVRVIDGNLAEVKCSCGLTVTVERDECGASAPTFLCGREGCTQATCEHEAIACSDCEALVCYFCQAQYGGRVLCVACLTVEMAAGAEELAEAVA